MVNEKDGGPVSENILKAGKNESSLITDESGGLLPFSE